MSGGSLNYLYSEICDTLEIPYAHYSKLCDEKLCMEARKNNPMHDRELSEMVFDIACLLHSLEWFESSDTSEVSYKRDVKKFKEKWFGNSVEKRIERYADDLKSYADELISELRGQSNER